MSAVNRRPANLPPAPGAEGTSLAVYLLLEPVIAGRTVVDVAPEVPEGKRRLEKAGARQVMVVAPRDPPLPLEDGSVDVVLFLSRFTTLRSEERRRWLAELARVMAPGGFCVLRAQCVAEADDAGEPLPDAPDDGVLTARALADLLGEHFGRADVVAETPFLGVSFFVPGTDDIAVNEDLTRLAAVPLYNLVFCSKTEAATWHLPESLLVPVDGLADLAAGAQRMAAVEPELTRLSEEVSSLRTFAREVSMERDSLREALMTYQDRSDQREAALGALRREAERHLKQISEDASALEMLAIERERAEMRAERAERSLADTEVALKRREAEVASLEREVARLRSRGGNGGGGKPKKGEKRDA